MPTLSPLAILTSLLLAGLVEAQSPGSFTAFGVGCPPATGNLTAEFYESFGGVPDLANREIELNPIGSFGYQVQPCAAPCWFSGFSNAIALTDDQTANLNLPFAFPHPGGSTTTVGMCSNGFLWLTGNSSAPFTPDVGDLLGQSARLAPLWTDLNPAVSGRCYFDTTATSAVFTWNNIPEYGQNGNLNTAQLQLYSNGRVVMAWRNLNIIAHGVLVGYSRGGGVPDPGSTDLTAQMPFSTGTGTRPPALAAAGGNPTIGQTFNLRVSQQPANSSAGFLVLGSYQLALDLTFLGMPGCTEYSTLDAVRFFVPAQPTATLGLAIPNAVTLIGTVSIGQAVLFSAGANPMGVALSNGGRITVGN